MMTYDDKDINHKEMKLDCHGVAVRLIFSPEDNREIPGLLSKILKSAYIRHRAS